MILQLLLQIISLLWLVVPLAAAAPPSLAKPNCTAKCGNVNISYPFGIGKGCYHDEWFAVTCNDSFTPNKPFLSKFNLEVLRVDLEPFYDKSLLVLNIPIGNAAAKRCPGHGTSVVWTSTNFTGSPFNFSSFYNEFTVVGCDNALLTSNGKIIAGCTSVCLNSSTNNGRTEGCYGISCCQTSMAYEFDLSIYNITISGNTGTNCTYAFLASTLPTGHRNLSSPYAMLETQHAPVAVSWRLTDLVDVEKGRFREYVCYRYTNGYYRCYCGLYYSGNPYLRNGCKVVEECANCEKDCHYNSQGLFYCKRSNKTEIILGSSLGGGFLLLVLCGFCFWLYKLIKKRRIMKLKKKFFKKNGGLLLQKQIASDECAAEKTIVYTSKELDKATENFNANRILGQGGQGTVYKGMLNDGKIVAIKKSKEVDESQLEQFINEVVILSQINHRNIVKLLGCCLETEVPLLVYEFISNGNLFQLIHDQNEEFPLSWTMRLQIATEVAGALAYLHSASSVPIYHRDIKTTNILLDEKFRAKVSDFGTSRTIAIEQTHLTTLVHGTFGYLDPEYFQSSQYTEKSDVYSFGVVLVELLTGQKPISSIKSEEERSLATRFIVSLKESRLFDLIDACVIEEATNEEVIGVADIARRCLSLNGKKRPTMKEVMMDLEEIRMSHMPLTAPKKFNEDKVIDERKEHLADASTSTQSSRNYTRVFSDVDPLVLNTF